MKVGYTPGSGWPAELAGTRLVPRKHLYDWGFPNINDYAGLDAVILTNASGSVNGFYQPGNVYWIEDHINLTGDTPLAGSDFLDCHQLYEPLPCLGHGVTYAQVRGPQYETPAEARMLARLGAHVVGMSTAVETLAAKRAGCRVFGLTFVANMSGKRSSHSDVLAAAALAAPQMMEALGATIASIK